MLMPNLIRTQLIEATGRLAAVASMIQEISRLANEGLDDPEQSHDRCKQIVLLLQNFDFT